MIAEEAVPERLPLNHQFGGIPGKTDQGRDRQPGQRTQLRPEQGQIPTGEAEQKQRQAAQDNGDGPLGEHGESENDPGEPPATATGCMAAPLAQKADGQGAGEQGIADSRATPEQHQRRQNERQGRGACRSPRRRIAWLREAQQGVAEHQQRRQCSEG